MATWQYEIYLLPSWSTDEQWDDRAIIMSDEFDATPLWKRYDRKEELLDSLSQILPAATSWTPEIAIWGSHDGDRIEVGGHGDALDEIIVRFDARNISNKFIRSIVDVAVAFGLVIMTDDMQIHNPDYQGLSNLLKTSEASRFVKDPAAFLKSLEKKPS